MANEYKTYDDRIEVVADDNQTLTLNFQDADGNAIDITGHEYQLTAKSDISDTTKVIDATSGTISDGTSGTATIDYTAPSESDTYYADVLEIDDSGDRTTVWQFELWVAPTTNGA